MNLPLFIIGICAIGTILYFLSFSKDPEKPLQYDPSNEVNAGAYVGGHPDIDDQIGNCAIIIGGEQLFICAHKDSYRHLQPEKIAEIPWSKITNITNEDASTMEKRVSVKRFLLVGLFALAWQKKEKVELAYLVIDWKDSIFDHSTLFQYQGEGAAAAANKARNQLMREYKSYVALHTAEPALA